MKGTDRKPNDILDTRRLSDRVYDYLIDQLNAGEIKYGETIRQTDVAAELNVSTMPVREAIKRLEMEDLVTIKPRSRCEVKTPTTGEFLELIELRVLMELHAVDKYLRDPDSGKLEPIRTIIARMQEIIDTGQLEEKKREFLELDRQFHIEICRLADNSHLNKFYNKIHLHMNMILAYSIYDYQFDDQRVRDHFEIARYLESASKKALAQLKRHLRLFEKAAVERFRSGFRF